MSNLDNNVNINKASRAYTHKVQKNDKNVLAPQHEEVAPEVLNDGTKAADSYGRILVKSGKIENPEMVQSVKESIALFTEHPELVSAINKACDDLEDILSASDEKDAYEKACCAMIDAGHTRMANKLRYKKAMKDIKNK